MTANQHSESIFESWHSEKQSAFLYGVMAAAERGTRNEQMFNELAGAAEHQAAHWQTQLSVTHYYQPDLRTRLVSALIGAIGPRRMLPVLAAMKVRGLAVYTSGEIDGHIRPTEAYQVERGHHGLSSGGNLRAGVFGVNDGLLSNTSLILGIAGAGAESRIILLTGIAGLAAGAFSMAAGEFVSVRSQRELYERQIAFEREELAEYPEEEAEELALIYAARGVPRDEALQLAQRLIADPQHALDTLTREELGLNPADLGSPWGAALSSFAAFAIGGLVPLVPFFFTRGAAALAITIGVTAASLFVIGASLSLFTGKSAWLSGARMLAIGVFAGGMTFAIGRLFGVAV